VKKGPTYVQVGLFLFDQVGHFLALPGELFHERQCITGALLSLLSNHQPLYRKHVEGSVPENIK